MKITKRLVSVLLVFSMIASMFLTVTAVENTAPATERTGITVERVQSADVFGEAVTHTKGYYMTDKKLEALPYSYEAWVYIPSEVYDTASGVILGTQWDIWNDTWTGGNSGDTHFSFGIRPGGHPTLVYGKNGSKQVWEATGKGVIPADKWTHVVMLHDTRAANRHVWCFIDGGGEGGWDTFEKVGKGAGLLELDSTALDNPVYLAGDGMGGSSHALDSGIILGDVAVYSDRRSATEVVADYTNGPDLTDSNLLLYYQISSANQNKDIKDASGHGYDMNFYRTFLTEAEMSEIRAKDEYEYAYSIAFLPDIQYMTNRYPTKLGAIFDYIVDTKEEKNLQYVVGVGDITDKDAAWEWDVVKAQYDLLDAAGIPYTLVRGNHDIYTTDKVMLDQTFGKDSEYYKHVAANGGFYDANSAINAYVRFEVGNVKYLILCLDWGIKDTKVLDWVDEVIEAHPDRRVMVTTHAWMNSDGTRFEDGDAYIPSDYNSANIDPQQMWDDCFAKHSNIDMILCGHMHSDNILVEPATGTNGNLVYQLLIDSQNSDLTVAYGGYNGLGLVAYMYFTEDGNHSKIEYYSTTYNKYYYEKNTEIRLDFDDQSAERTGVELGEGEYYIADNNLDEIPATYQMWIKIPSEVYSTANGIILGNKNSADQSDYFAIGLKENGKIYFECSNNGKVRNWNFGSFTKCVIPADTWTHVTIIQDVSASKVYCVLNGTWDTGAGSGNTNFVQVREEALANPVRIGDINGIVIGDVNIYSEVRGSTLFPNDYANGPDLNNENLMAYYKISSSKQGRPISDITGNGYDLKYVNVNNTPDTPAAPETPVYGNFTDAAGNALNPYFVNGVIWDNEDGNLFLPEKVGKGFLLFDNKLETNRIEATIVVKDNMGSVEGYDGNKRAGIVFALTDYDGDGTFNSAEADVSYYWAFINNWGHVELRKMGRYQCWTGLGSSAAPISNVTEGVKLAAEWDDQGHIVIYANGEIVINTTDTTDPLSGDLYGLLAVKHYNYASNPALVNSYYTSFVADGASETPVKNVSVTVDPAGAGTVTGAGDYYLGQNATLTATPNEGYYFVGWYVGDTLAFSDMTVTFPVTEDLVVTAKFTTVAHNVTVTAGANGTVAGSGTYGEGANVTVVATPDAGYKFVGWYNGNTKVSADATYKFTVTADVTLTAQFDKITYSVAVDATGDVLNPIFVNGNYWTEENSTIKPAQGDMENFILFDNPLNANRVEATFRNLPKNNDGNTRNGIVFALTDIDGDNTFGMGDTGVSYYFACISGWGEVQLIQMGAGKNWSNYTTGGSVDVSSDVTLAVEWDTEGNIMVFANEKLCIEVKLAEPLTGDLYGVLMRSYANTSDGGFTHKHVLTSFVAGVHPSGGGNEEEMLTVNVTTAEGGTVTGAGDYYLGQKVTVTATPDAGYAFVGWYNGETLVSADATYTFTADADCTLTAKFTSVTYTVTVTPGANGAATGNGTYGEGVNATVTATANTGYKFVGWYVDGELVSTEATYTFTVNANVALTAKFEKVVYTIVTDAEGNLLNPYFVSGNTWTETDGTMKPAVGEMENFILFDTPLANNRVEATFRDLPLNYDGNTRNGIVFALTDIDGDNTFGMNDDGVSYYFACVSGYGQVQLIQMGAGKGWSNYTTGGTVDVSKDVTLAVEWDTEGNIKVFANGILCIDVTLAEPLTGNLYGVLMRSWANTEGGGFAHKHVLTSFVAGGENASTSVNVDATANSTEKGTVTGAGEYEIGDTVTLTATASDGYYFVGWYEDGKFVSSDATYTFTAQLNRTLTAEFAAVVVYGDANGDGEISMNDVIILRSYITNFDYDAKTSSVSVGAGADANGDGEINMKDVIILRQYITNFDYDTGSSSVVLGPNWNSDGELKILAIGNSFSVDAMQYVYQIAQEAGIKNITLGNMYIGGCSLATHLSNARNNSAAYEYYTNTNGTWVKTENVSIETAVTSDNWDFITFQQASGYSGLANTYDDLTELMNIVRSLNQSATFAWHMTWAYAADSTHSHFANYNNDQMTMYNAIVNAVETKILTNDQIKIVIPSGTAVQNVRSSFVGDITRDGYHLSNGLGRYVAGLTFLQALTGLTVEDYTSRPGGVSSRDVLVIAESVENAFKTPFAVTQSQYLVEPGDDSANVGVIPEGYVQLTATQMGLTAASYYNSSSTDIWENTSSAFARGFMATKKFTREELPVGSIIEVAEGWRYRPEGWEYTGTRPDNVSKIRIIIDEEWWGTYTERAFNISQVSHTTSNAAEITLSTEEVANTIFKIIVPESALTSAQ